MKRLGPLAALLVLALAIPPSPAAANGRKLPMVASAHALCRHPASPSSVVASTWPDGHLQATHRFDPAPVQWAAC